MMLDLSRGHDVGVVEVVRHFLSLEVRDAGLGRDQADLDAWIRRLKDGEEDGATSVLREFLAAKSDSGNPVGTWILYRGQQIRRWLFVEGLPLASLYTEGVSSNVDDALRQHGGSLVAFAPHAHRYPKEFNRLDDVPQCRHRRLIVVVTSQDATQNRAELIDGFHRAIAMIRNKDDETAAFVAEAD